MDSLLMKAIIEAGRGTECVWPNTWLYVHWAFWIGFTLGLAGLIAGFFVKPRSMK